MTNPRNDQAQGLPERKSLGLVRHDEINSATLIYGAMTKKLRIPACSFLRKLISPYGFGSKDAFGYRRPTNQSLLDDYNRKGFIRGLNNAQMLDHFRARPRTTSGAMVASRRRTP